MKLRVLFLCAAFGALGAACASAAPAPLRVIEDAELHRKLDPAVIAALDTPDAARAALAIGRIKDPAGAIALRPLLHRDDSAVRAMGAYALGLLADGTALAELRSLARSDASSAVRYAACDAIGRIVSAAPALGTRGVANDLLIVARTDADAVVRAHAVAQLDAFRSAAFAAEMARAIERIEVRDADETVRWHAAWTLFRGYAPIAGAAFLAKALHDPSEIVRIETLRAYGRRAKASDAQLVHPLLDDPSWRVQLEATEALRRIAKQPPTEHLKEDRPGLKLPPLDPLANAACGPAGPASTAALAAKPKAAPDPRTFALPAYASATTAAQMNGPQFAKHPRVLICTTKGAVIVRMYPEWAPSTVANFIGLADAGYFDGNRWFRIVPDFVVQTGDPTNTGDGDAGFTIPAEENPVEQRSGVISMGLDYEGTKAKRDSAGTQFYVTLSPQLHLDRDFTVFGEVESGFDVLAHLIESDLMIRVRRIGDD